MDNKNIENVTDYNKENGKKKPSIIKKIIAGLLTGILNGLFGGGGGMVLVPMLTKLMGEDTKKAHATAILIILPMSIVSGIFYAAFGSFDLDIGIPVMIGVVAGGIAGALLLKKISSKSVTAIFYVVMAIAGLKMLLF